MASEQSKLCHTGSLPHRAQASTPGSNPAKVVVPIPGCRSFSATTPRGEGERGWEGSTKFKRDSAQTRDSPRIQKKALLARSCGTWGERQDKADSRYTTSGWFLPPSMNQLLWHP